MLNSDYVYSLAEKKQQMKNENIVNFRSTRIPVEYKAEYSIGNISGESLITDICSNGIALRVKQAFVIGDEVHVKSIITNDLILEFSGTVRNIAGNIVGIKIITIDPNIHERFKQHIEGLLRLAHKSEVEKYNLIHVSSFYIPLFIHCFFLGQIILYDISLHFNSRSKNFLLKAS